MLQHLPVPESVLNVGENAYLHHSQNVLGGHTGHRCRDALGGQLPGKEAERTSGSSSACHALGLAVLFHSSKLITPIC